MTEEAKKAPDIEEELGSSVAYSLIEDAFRLVKINDPEMKYFKKKYREMYEVMKKMTDEEVEVRKQIEVTNNEILSEKITMEKTVMEEEQESRTLRKLEEARAELQKELEFSEQKDTMVKFELEELKKVHDELKTEFEEMEKKNIDTVAPVLKSLREENESLISQLQNADNSFEKETAQKEALKKRCAELEEIQEKAKGELETKKGQLEIARNEPPRLQRQVDAVNKAGDVMAMENKAMEGKFKSLDAEMEQNKKKRAAGEAVRRSLNEKLELNMQTIDKREEDVAVVRKAYEEVLAKADDLQSVKVEYNVKRKEIESQARHKLDQLNITRKEYTDLKSRLKKKMAFNLSIKAMIPTLQDQLKGAELQLQTYNSEKTIKQRELTKLKDEVDNFAADLLTQEGIESSKKADLEDSIKELDEAEIKVARATAETKKQAKLLQVLSTQRDIKARDFARVDAKEKEARMTVKTRELEILDLTKRCQEISNRLKEFTALYEVVKNERNKFVSLLQSSTQATAEIKEKNRILTNEVEILGNESKAKDTALTKEKSQHAQAQNHRNSLRQDVNRLLSEYRSKQGVVEQQIMDIGKLNTIINNLEKDMIELKRNYERNVEERNVTGVQLIDRNDELCILYERSNQQSDALKKGEVELMKKDNELKLIRLHTEEMKRQYTTAKHRLPEKEVYAAQIEELEVQIQDKVKEIDDLSSKLEDPRNGDRWRALEGDDPSTDQLLAKIQVLEGRLDSKRELLLERELVLEEVNALTDRLRKQAVNKRDSAKAMATELNGLQGKIRDITRVMVATVSELSMYQATALRLQQEKISREKILEEATWKLDHGEAPTEDAIKAWNRKERKRLASIEAAIRKEEEFQEQGDGKLLVRTAAEPRPTAYIPDDMGIPKPYGAQAPFKPTVAGASMRHIRNPDPKPIEI